MKRKALLLTLVLALACTAMLATACTPATDESVVIYEDIESGLRFAAYSVGGEEPCTYAKVTGYIGEQETGSNVLSVTVPAKITVEGVEYDVTTVGSLAFERVKISEIEFSEGIEVIEPFACSYCEATIISLPSTVNKIGEYAFVNCNSLRDVKIKAVTPPELGRCAFMFYQKSSNTYEPSSILKISVPKEAAEAYRESWTECAGNIAR